MKKKEWSCQDIDTLRREFPVRTTAEVAEMLGRTVNAVSVKAGKMGLKKVHLGIVWTPKKVKLLTDFFPIMFNRPLAAWIGVSMRSLIRKARELGLEKEPGFLDTRRSDITELARNGLKKTHKTGGRFQKGIRNNPEGEFKPGHKESIETRTKRIAALKDTFRRKKQTKRFRAEYGINIR